MTFSSFLILWAVFVMFTAIAWALILYFFLLDVTNNK